MNLKLIPVLILLLFAQCHTRSETDVHKLIQEIKQQFVPDTRTGVFSVEATVKSSKIHLTGETDSHPAHSALIKKLSGAGFHITDSIIILPHKIMYPWAIVSVSVANLRKSPSHGAEMVTQALMGTPVKILKEDDGWALVQTPDNYLAWCELDITTPLSNEEFANWRKSEKVIFTQWYGTLLDSASQAVVCDLVAGCILTLNAEKGNSYYVSTPDGRKGMLMRNAASMFSAWKKTAAIHPDQLLSRAAMFTGTPYLWGGASVKGVDCSGFVRTVYFLNGTILQRDASQQANYGTEIPVTGSFNFEPGDLLFFGRKATGEKPERITHVGMYTGNAEFIHASGMVKVNSFDSTRANYSRYRTISLLRVRRITGTPNSEGIVKVKDHPWY